MYVIDVIPLSRTAPGILSYRSKTDLPVGTIVSITVRRKATQGIVIDSAPVTAAKEMLKHARFLLSRSVPSPSGALPEAVLKAAERTAKYHATTSGAVLAAMFGEHVRADIELPTTPFSLGSGYEHIPCEQPLHVRAKTYRSAIRQALDTSGAILLIAPTLPELSYWKDKLKEFRPLVLSGALTSAKRANTLLKAVAHEGLIIATPAFSWVPIEQLSLVILDRVSAGTYTLPKRPYLSVPYAVDALMRERALPLIIGDFPLPLEYRRGDSPLAQAALSPVTLIDARRPQNEQEAPSGPWKAIPEAVTGRLREELSAGGRVVVLAARKGYAPAVVCRDCGQAQTDERGQAYSFSMANGERVFRTSDGNTTEAKRTCQRCGSWNLLPLGIGIERVEEELRAVFPEANIVALPPELLASPRKAREAVQEAHRPGTIVIGTEALLPWLYAGQHKDAGLPLGVIASADSLLSQPFWRARERFVRLAYFLNGLSREMLLVTRRPEDSAVDAAVHPDSTAFWQEERALRKALGYPPYGTIITISIDGANTKSILQAREIKERLSSYDPAQLPARPLRGTTWRTTLVIHLPEDSWPNDELAAYLQALPPSALIRISPESLW